MVGGGTVKEDDPVTWETPGVLWEQRPGDGDPEILSDAPPVATSGGRPRAAGGTAHRIHARPKGKARRGQTGDVLMRQGSRMAA